MKKLIILLPLLTLLASCSSNDSSGTAQSDSNEVSNNEPTLVSNAELISDKYADNFLPCRKSAPDKLNRVLSKALTAKGVILYFHGGLSTDEYMREKLGPAIMQSMITEDNLNGLYPIFVNYDADVFTGRLQILSLRHIQKNPH